MCDEDLLRTEGHARRQAGLSKRDFNLLLVSGAALALLPGAVRAAEITESMVEVRTADGVADCYFAHPSKGAHPGVLLWPDFMSLRPAYRQMARRLAQSGYAVLAINPYYRGKRSPVVDRVDFKDAEAMKMLGALAGALSPDTARTDAAACVAFLDAQQAVDRRRPIGTLGYCMGGALAFRSAAAVPERVGAVAAFHANLVTDRPTSVHLAIPTMKASALIAIAEDDDRGNPTEKDILREAFARAGLAAEVEVYAGTKHGWCTPDMITLYNEAGAARAWARLLALFDRSLANA